MLTAAISGSSPHHRDTRAGESHFGTLILAYKYQDIILCFCSAVKPCPTPCDPRNCNVPGSSAAIISQSLLKLMSTELMMLSNHLILCHSLLLQSSIFSSIKVFSNELGLHQWPKYMTLSTSQSASQHSQPKQLAGQWVQPLSLADPLLQHPLSPQQAADVILPTRVQMSWCHPGQWAGTRPRKPIYLLVRGRPAQGP